MNALHSSASNEHYTPVDYVEAARYVLGNIDLDPASCEVANRVVRADRIFTIEDDGLKQEWHGRVFLNPPGGRGQAKRWWWKLLDEWMAGNVEAAIFVGFNLDILQTCQVGGPQTGHPLSFPFCVPRKRVAYDHIADDNRVSGDSPTHGSLFIYLPDDHGVGRELFREAFEPFGFVRL